DLCASFQDAVTEIVTDRLRIGLRVFRERFGKPTALVVAGGVAANEELRHAVSRTAYGLGTPLVAPPAALCTDNGAIIAWAGAERLSLGLPDRLDASPRARWPLQSLQVAEPPADEAGAAAEAAPVETAVMDEMPASPPSEIPEPHAEPATEAASPRS